MTPIIYNEDGDGFMAEHVVKWENPVLRDGKCFLQIRLSTDRSVFVEEPYIEYVKARLGIQQAQSDFAKWIAENVHPKAE